MAYILYAQIAHTSYLCTIVVWPACARLYNCEHNLRQTWCRSSKVRISRTPYTNRALPREMHGVHGMVNRRDDDDGYIIILYIYYTTTLHLLPARPSNQRACVLAFTSAHIREMREISRHIDTNRAQTITPHTHIH